MCLCLTQAQALLGKAMSEHTTQRNAEVKRIINKDRQVAPKRMPLGARLAVNTHYMGGRFVDMRTNGKDDKIGLMKNSRQN